MSFRDNFSLSDRDPIFTACESGDFKAVKEFLERGGSSYAASKNRPSLAGLALRRRRLDVVKVMKDFDFEVDRPLNRFGETPLLIAIQETDLPMVKYLISERVDVNRADEFGFTPICGAAAAGDVEILKAIIAAGGNIEEKRFRGITPFMSAANANKVSVMDFLQKSGANIEAKNSDEATAIICVAMGGQIEAAQWLVEHGADLSARDDFRKTALEWAKENGHQEIVHLLSK